jgi:hypothetical protein
MKVALASRRPANSAAYPRCPVRWDLRSQSFTTTNRPTLEVPNRPFIVWGYLTAGINATGDLLFFFFFPTDTFTRPVLRAQAAFGVERAADHVRGSADVMITNRLGNAVSAQRADSVTGGSDLHGLGNAQAAGWKFWLSLALPLDMSK